MGLKQGGFQCLGLGAPRKGGGKDYKKQILQYLPWSEMFDI